MPALIQHTQWTERLAKLGAAVRTRLIEARQQGEDFATAVAQEGGDTIFAVDRHVEPTIEAEINSWPDELKPLRVVAEGMGETGEQRFGPNEGDAKWCVLIDPIDGTRNIMYDKRAAWFIAAVTPGTVDGREPSLADSIASVIVELPPSKQSMADVFATAKDGQLIAMRVHLESGGAVELSARPSTADSLLNGFGQVSNFFPGTKVLASELMERIVRDTLGEVEPGQASVFDDQFISTAGQMVELIVGHDRFCCDLRPLFYRIIEKESGNAVRGLECHPYDMSGLLVAQNAGVIVTDGLGTPLDAPLDVDTGVHWVGYANENLRDRIEPSLQAWFKEKGVA